MHLSTPPDVCRPAHPALQQGGDPRDLPERDLSRPRPGCSAARFQAAIFSPTVKARCSSRRVAPVARMARTIRSIVTEGSPASILATRDWLEPIRWARSTWERRRFCRACLSAPARESLSSTSAASSSLNLRKSLALPTFQPAARSLFNFVAFMELLLYRGIAYLQTSPDEKAGASSRPADAVIRFRTRHATRIKNCDHRRCRAEPGYRPGQRPRHRAAIRAGRREGHGGGSRARAGGGNRGDGAARGRRLLRLRGGRHPR